MILKDIAGEINAELQGDGEMRISGVSSIASPVDGTILFTEKLSMLKQIPSGSNVAIITPSKPDMLEGNFLIHPSPRAAFAIVSSMFNQPYWLEYTGLSEHAHIEPDAYIAESAVICAGVFIGSKATIGANTRILPNVYIGRGVSIGDNCVILPGAVILEGSQIGNRVIINSNAVIGSEGFGYTEYEKQVVKIPQVGGVVIGDDVEIGSCACIDRGTIDDTVIDSGSKIDNLVQIAHNVRIGKHVYIAAQAGLPGRVTVEDFVKIGGQAGLQNGINVGKGASIGGQAGVVRSVEAGESVAGYPAMPLVESMRIVAFMKRLPELFRDVKELKQKMEQ